MLTNERKEQIVEVLQNLIQRRSYSGEEKEVAEYIKKLCLEVGYDTVHIDKYGNVIGSVKGKYEGPKVLMDGHIDTVPYYIFVSFYICISFCTDAKNS